MEKLSLSLPVEDAGKYDVLIVGGGLSGVCAAIAAARNGAKTLLAEAMPYIGGNGTTGLPLSSFRATNNHNVVVGGIPAELLERLRQKQALDRTLEDSDWLPVDCEKMQIVLTHMLDEAGVELLTYAPLLSVERRGNTLISAVFYGQENALRYEAKMFIDASGDAQLAKLAGLATPMGRERDGKTQAMTLMFTLGGVDSEQMLPWDQLTAKWEQLRAERGGWLNPRSGPALSGCLPVPGKPGVYTLNVTRILVEKGTDSRQLTQAEKEGRYQVEEFVEFFLRPHIRGFKDCYLTQIAPRVGIRETRRITGLYTLQREDLVGLRKFDDAIACNSYPVDIHSPDGGSTEFEEGKLPEGGYYTISYRCLVASGVDNLLASGRCISASHEALSAVRVLSAAMATGEAAGTAGALCACLNQSAAELDVEGLRSVLKKQNAIID